MKTLLLIPVLGLGLAAAADDAPPVPRHSFAIDLAPNVNKRVVQQGVGEWWDTKPASPPVISDADLVAYDFTRHLMTLKPEAMARIPRPPVEGTPFVVAVDGQPVYPGAFATRSSSRSFAVPTITVDGRAMNTNQALDTLLIERAYPQPSFGVGPDPRSDPRIRGALAALRKLSAAGPEPDADLTSKVDSILRECQGVRPGMTRSELLGVFTTEGGLSTAKERTFVHRCCPYIKVDVRFTLSEPIQSVIDERPTDIISRISQPYLQWRIVD
jgi:hypothetical protein